MGGRHEVGAHDHLRTGPRPLFRLAGLPVSVNSSALVTALLLAWGLAETALPRMAPGHASPSYWTVGVVGALLLILSVLVHELAHALVARRSGLEVEQLTLWPFGGVATLRGEVATPAVDARIAAAGPAASLAVGLGFGALGYTLVSFDADALAIGVVAWLALANVVLAVLNLVPGTPLDGGRFLRAFLWLRWGDRVRAAAAATTAGHAVAGGLVLLAAFSFLRGDTVGSSWLVLVAWFIHLAARQAER